MSIRAFLVTGLFALCATAEAEPPAPWAAADCAWRIVLTCPTAAEGRELPDAAVFFVDFAKLGEAVGGTVDAVSMRLLPRGGGAAIPFSLDHRYGDRERTGPGYHPPPTGHSGEISPLADRKLRRVGFISFKPVAGQAGYDLYFSLSAGKGPVRDKPDAAVRPWWMDVVRDPNFAVDADKNGKPDLYTWYTKEKQPDTWRIAARGDGGAERCVELTNPTGGTLMAAHTLFVTDQRAAGRRIILYLQVCPAEKDLVGQSVGVSFPVPGNLSAPGGVNWYFGKVPAGTWCEMCSEPGRVNPQYVPAPANMLWLVFKSPCRLAEIHVQLPPALSDKNRIGVDTDVAYPEDAILLSWQSESEPHLFPLQFIAADKSGRTQAVEGARLENWAEGFTIHARLLSPGADKPVAELNDTAAAGESWRGAMPLRNARPGAYQVLVEVKSRRRVAETVARLARELRVVAGPFDSGKDKTP